MVFNLEFHLEFTKTNHFIKNAVQMNSQQLTYFYKCDEDSPKPTNNKHTNTDINIQRDTLTQTHKHPHILKTPKKRNLLIPQSYLLLQ